MPKVRVPGYGVVQFPDDMTEAQISAEVSKLVGSPEAPAGPRGLGPSFWAQANPANIISGISDTFWHPIRTLQGIGQAQGQPYSQMIEAAKRGDVPTALSKGLAWLTPFAGPTLGQAGEQMKSGDIGGGIGTTLGLATMLGGPSLAKAGVTGLRGTRAGTAIADVAERSARNRMASPMTPVVGQHAKRWGVKARKIAPQLAEEPGLGAWTRSGLSRTVASKLHEATAALDAAMNATLKSGQLFPTGSLVRILKGVRQRYIAEAATYNDLAKAGIQVPSTFKIGKNVSPSPNLPEIGVLDNMIAEVEALGPHAKYESIRRIRDSYDKLAQVKYNPSVTEDFLTKQSQATAAYRGTSALRASLAQWSPETASSNARWSLFKSADDLLNVVEETERARPRVGRRIYAGIAGSIGGAAVHGTSGAAIGAIVAPMIDVVVSMGPTAQIQAARLLKSISNGLRAGNPRMVQGGIVKLARMTGRVGQVQAALGAGRMPALGPAMAGGERDEEP